jgi:tRNA threonylcarbamoyladenosine biosynthesis protein TsaE
VLNSLPKPANCGLIGDLGAGKTTLVREIVKQLGGDPNTVASPTFALSYAYPIPKLGTIEHWDLYRLKYPPEELLYNEEPGLLFRFIEWPQILTGSTLELQANIEIKTLGEERREFEVTTN